MLSETRVNRSRGIFSNSTHNAGSQLQQQQSFHLRNTELRRLLELDQSKQLNNSSNYAGSNPKNGQNNNNNSIQAPIDSQANRTGTQTNNGNNKIGRRVTLNTILGYPLDVKIPKKERKKLRSDQWTSTLDIQNLRGSCSIINSQGETQSVSPSRVRVSMPVIEEFQQIVQAEKQQQEAKTPGIMKIIQIKQEKELNRLDMKIEQFNRKNPVLSKKLPVFFFPDNKEKRTRSQEKNQQDGLSQSMVIYKQNTSNQQQIGYQSMILKSNEEQNQHNVSSSVLHSSSSSLKGTEKKKSNQTDVSGLRMRPPAISIQDSAKLRQPSKHLVKVVKSQSVYESQSSAAQPQQSFNDPPVSVHPPSMNSNSSSRTNQNTSSNRNSPKLNYYLSMPKILKRQTEGSGEYQQFNKKHDLSRSSVIDTQKSVGQLQQQQSAAAASSSPIKTQLYPLGQISRGDKSINSSSSSSSDNEDSVEGAVTFEQNTNFHNNEDPLASSSPSHLFKLRLRSLSPTNKRHLLEQIDLQRRKTLKSQQQQSQQQQSPISPQIQSKPSSPLKQQTSNQKKNSNITLSEEKTLPFLLFPSQFFQKKSTKKSINRGNIQGNQTAINSFNSSNSKKNTPNQQPQTTFPIQQLSILPPAHQKPSSHHQLTSQGYLNQILQKSLSKQADLSAIRAGTPLSREIKRNSRKIRQFGEESQQKSSTNIDQSNNRIPSSTFNFPESATNAYIDAAVSKKLLKYQFAADEACIGIENALRLDTKAMKEIAASEFDCETLSFYYRKYLQAAIGGYAKSKQAKDEILQGDQENDNDENSKEEQLQQDKKLNPKELFVLFRVSHELFDRLQMILQTRLRTLHVPQDIEKGILSASKWLKNSVVASNVLEELGSGSIVSQLVTQVAKEIQINTNIQLLSFLDNNNYSDPQSLQLSNSIDPQILQSKEKQEALLDSACLFFIELLSDQHAKVNSTLEHFLSQRLNFTQIEFFLLKNYTFHTLLPTIKKHIILAALEKIESLRMKILPSQGDQAILSKPNSFQLLLFQLNSKCGKNLQRLIKKKSKVIKGTVALKGLEAKKEKEQKKKGIGRGVSFSDFILQKARNQQARLNEIAENDEDKQTNYPDGFENSPYFPRKPMIREQPAVTSLHLILNPTINKQGSVEEVVFSPPSLKYIEERGEQSTQERNEEQNKLPGSQIIQISLSQLQNEEGEQTQKHSTGTASSLSPKRYSRPPKLLQRLASIHGSNYNINTNTVSFSSPRRIQNENMNLNENSSNTNVNPFDMHMFEGSNIQQSASLDPTKPLKPNDSQDLLRLSLNFLLSSPNLLCMARLVETQLKSSEDFIELTRLMMIELKNQEAVALSESMLMNLQVRILKVKILLGLEHVYFGLFQDFHEDIEELLKEEVDLYCEVNCSVEVAIFAKALDMKFLSFVIDLVFTHFDIFNADDVPIAKQFFSIEDAALNIQLIALETVMLSQQKGQEKEGEWFEKQAAIKGFIGLLREILLPYQKR